MSLTPAGKAQWKIYEDSFTDSSVAVGSISSHTFSIPSGGTKIIAATVSCNQCDEGYCGIQGSTDTSISVRWRNEYTSALTPTWKVKLLYI